MMEYPDDHQRRPLFSIKAPEKTVLPLTVATDIYYSTVIATKDQIHNLSSSIP